MSIDYEFLDHLATLLDKTFFISVPPESGEPYCGWPSPALIDGAERECQRRKHGTEIDHLALYGQGMYLWTDADYDREV